MFLRKNQSILADHYTRLVDQETDRLAATQITDALSGAEDEDDFITLKRVDHELDDDTPPLVEVQSKRSQRKTKKDLVKDAPRGEKLVFDDDGEVSYIYIDNTIMINIYIYRIIC
jgi:ATP-dependent RNA helicase DDX10/DBP4